MSSGAVTFMIVGLVGLCISLGFMYTSIPLAGMVFGVGLIFMAILDVVLEVTGKHVGGGK